MGLVCRTISRGCTTHYCGRNRVSNIRAHTLLHFQIIRYDFRSYHQKQTFRMSFSLQFHHTLTVHCVESTGHIAYYSQNHNLFGES